MIASLKGVLGSVAEGSAVVDVSGVGYLVFCSGRTLANLPQPGEAVGSLSRHMSERTTSISMVSPSRTNRIGFAF